MTNTLENDEFGKRVLQQFMEIWITPAIEERQINGDLPKPFPLKAAQIIFFPDNRKPQINLNKEVKAIGQAKLKDGVTKEKGEAIYEHEIDGWEDFVLDQEEFPDCGHATIVLHNNRFIVRFDFRYNKSLSEKHLKTANEFIGAAEFSLQNKYWSSFVDNLFSAKELIAKAILLQMADPNFRAKTNHKAIKQKYNNFAKLGNVKAQYRDVFNKLAELRSSARYLQSDFSLSADEATEYLETTKEAHYEAHERIKDKF